MKRYRVIGRKGFYLLCSTLINIYHMFRKDLQKYLTLDICCVCAVI